MTEWNYMSRAFRNLPAMDRVMIRSEWRGPCVVYTGTLNKGGYGTVHSERKQWLVHRLMWTLLVGPIPEGLTLDHLCRNTSCWWTDHLEPVPGKVNTLRGHSPAAMGARQTHCVNGHEFTPENTWVYEKQRVCKACQGAAQRAWRKRRREMEMA
jgi:hypothetical protein